MKKIANYLLIVLGFVLTAIVFISGRVMLQQEYSDLLYYGGLIVIVISPVLIPIPLMIKNLISRRLKK